MSPDAPKPLDVEKELEDIARGLSEADAARVRTLIYLASRQEASVTLPQPMSQKEMIERILPLLRALGRPGAQMAYRKAWPNSTTRITDVPKIEVNDLDIGPDVKFPISLKQLYKMAPETKRPGYPRGYPARGALDEKKEWCHSEYLKVLRARKQRELQREQEAEASAPAIPETGTP
jgi:hypothetical protein